MASDSTIAGRIRLVASYGADIPPDVRLELVEVAGMIQKMADIHPSELEAFMVWRAAVLDHLPKRIAVRQLEAANGADYAPGFDKATGDEIRTVGEAAQAWETQDLALTELLKVVRMRVIGLG